MNVWWQWASEQRANAQACFRNFPETMKREPVAKKRDVYSFGIFLATHF